MKKLLLAALLLGCCAAAQGQGQVVLSGSLGFSRSGAAYSVKGSEAYAASAASALPDGRTFIVAPRVGYVLPGQWLEVGVGGGYSNRLYDYETGTNSNERGEWVKLSDICEKGHTFSVSPYVRTRCFAVRRFAFMVQLAAEWQFGKGNLTETEQKANGTGAVVSSYDTKSRGFVMRMMPVLQYRFNHHFRMDLFLDAASVAYSRATTTTYGRNSAEETGQLVTGGFELGLNGSGSALATVGFSYQF